MKLFYWNKLAWLFAFNKLLRSINIDFKQKKIIEIGATEKSSVALYFLKENQIILSSNNNQTIRLMKETFTNQNLRIVHNDIFDFKGKYDVIIMKSILGGLCRKEGSVKANRIIESLVNSNLNDGGVLITLDNGMPIYNRLIKNFGARKNNWYFFKYNDLKNFDGIFSFGFLSSFSFRTRIGFIGAIIEDILYYIDRIIHYFYKHYPTIIAKYYINKRKIYDKK